MHVVGFRRLVLEKRVHTRLYLRVESIVNVFWTIGCRLCKLDTTIYGSQRYLDECDDVSLDNYR